VIVPESPSWLIRAEAKKNPEALQQDCSLMKLGNLVIESTEDVI